MPNYCNFNCRITGPKKGIDRFIAAARTDYQVGQPNEPEHFWRVFEFYINDYEEVSDGIYQLTANGYCAWSVHTCFMQEGYQRHWDKDGVEHNGTTVEKISDQEDLVVEFYSDEIGMAFAEHILVVCGNTYIEDTVDYTECDYEMDWEECNERSGLDWSEQQWKEYFQKEDYYICCEYNWEFTDHMKYFKENK